MEDVSASATSVLPPLPPLARTPAGSRISILHPRYKKGEDLLFCLPAIDYVTELSSNTRTWGHHHATALIAGGIIANNAFDDVYFSHDQYGKLPIAAPLDGILEPGHYWLQLNSIAGGMNHTPATCSPPSTPTSASTDKYKYPIVPSFTDWPFPHGNLPKEWRQPHNPPDQQDTDQVTDRCFITDIKIGLENCHLVPRAQLEWFNRNEMGDYCEISTTSDIDDSGNQMLLMSNLHWAFDRALFIIVPKPSTGSSSSSSSSGGNPPLTSTSVPTSKKEPQLYAFTPHVINTTLAARDLTTLYHNRSMQPKYFNNIKREFLFARFAWALFIYLQKFLQESTVPLELLVVEKDRYVARSMTGNQFTQLRETRCKSAGGSRKRRGRSNEDGEPNDEDYMYEDDMCEKRQKRCSGNRQSLPFDYHSDDCDYEDIFRGRPMHRGISLVLPGRPGRDRDRPNLDPTATSLLINGGALILAITYADILVGLRDMPSTPPVAPQKHGHNADDITASLSATATASSFTFSLRIAHQALAPRLALTSRASLDRFEKPVLLHQLEGNIAHIPEDIKDLYKRVKAVAQYRQRIVPHEVRSQIETVDDDVPDYVFRPPVPEPGPDHDHVSALATHKTLRSIVRAAGTSEKYKRLEAGWNHHVHTPLLKLVFGSQLVDDNADIQTAQKQQQPVAAHFKAVMGVTVVGTAMPLLQQPRADVPNLACSFSVDRSVQSSQGRTVDLAHMDSHAIYSRSESKKVGYVLAIYIDNKEPLHRVISKTTFEHKPGYGHVNQTLVSTFYITQSLFLSRRKLLPPEKILCCSLVFGPLLGISAWRRCESDGFLLRLKHISQMRV
ncbi:hypothetical protein F5Y07DRAFT_404419 [Xylaria sp. FL0933]|nr:hypothetical protein F5Y07DRAFT_404419 [Xylaria sp. FL0933]